MEETKKDFAYIALAPSDSNLIVNNYTLETKIAIDPATSNQDPNLSYGLVFDYVGKAQLCSFWIKPSSGKWSLECLEGNTNKIAEGTSDLIKNNPGAWNILKLERTVSTNPGGVYVSAWINGLKVVDNQRLETAHFNPQTGILLHADPNLPSSKNNSRVARVMADYFVKETGD